jgi:tetratricopeptide (TPR) repeat protein
MPGYYSIRGSMPPASEPERGLLSSAPPGRYSMGVDDLSRRSSSAPPSASEPRFDSPLAALIHELSNGQERERWCAGRLRTALHEELSGNVQEAIDILQGVLLQVNDERIRAEHDRLQTRSLKATSGFYRSQALRAESADRPKEAAESWRKVLEAFPDDAEATLHAAKCSLEAGDLKRASVHARRAAELAPDSVAAHKILLRFFRKTGMEHNANREREILRRLARK